MILLMAPFYIPTTVIALPNPALQDTVSNNSSVNVHQMMDASLYSYVKTQDTDVVRLEYAFRDVSRLKVVELQDFIINYSAEYCRLIDYNGIGYRVAFDNLPIETTPTTKRVDATGYSSGSPSNPSGERLSFQLTFLGVKV